MTHWTPDHTLFDLNVIAAWNIPRTVFAEDRCTETVLWAPSVAGLRGL